MESFDTKLESFENAVQCGVIKKQNHLNTHCFIGNRDDRGIRKRSHSISVSKREQAKDIRTDKYGVIETSNVILLTKTEWPGVMCSRKD